MADENIAAFGGAPENVTIWGESAGAGNCTMLPLLESSQKYFKKVIAQSGAPVQTNSLEEAIAGTNELMEALGCKTVADLQKVDAQKSPRPAIHSCLRTSRLMARHMCGRSMT